jgi:hypothetical protein
MINMSDVNNEINHTYVICKVKITHNGWSFDDKTSVTMETLPINNEFLIHTISGLVHDKVESPTSL